MPATFYGLTSCDTCRAALKAIAAGGINIDRKDVRADGAVSYTHLTLPTILLV